MARSTRFAMEILRVKALQKELVAKARRVLASESWLAVSEMMKSLMVGWMLTVCLGGAVRAGVGTMVECGLDTSVFTGLSVVSGLMAGPNSDLTFANFARFATI